MRVLMHWDCMYLCTHVPKSSSCLLNPTIYMCLFVFRMPHLIRFLYLFSVKSAFSWCVDEDLLEMNNLISPKDYLATLKPHVRAPAAGIWPIYLKFISCQWFGATNFLFLSEKWNPAKPTIAFTMHVSRKPQDDGYTVIRRPEKTGFVDIQLDHSVTFESCSDTPRRKETQREVRRLIRSLYIAADPFFLGKGRVGILIQFLCFFSKYNQK